MSQTFRDLPFMGVIRVNNAAMKAGWRMGDPAWSNLGQGQPEVGEMAGAPPRISDLPIDPADHAYGPVEGVPELREAVAAHYNRLYRRGKASQYTAANVAVAPGGRAALTRVFAALDNLRLGYFTPDYTAYEDALNTFTRVQPVHIGLDEAKGFRIEPDELEHRVKGDALSTLLISNPCNPTGVCIAGDELVAWLNLSRKHNCTLILDEFYSHFTYGEIGNGPVSAAAYVEDVERDPVVLIDGLTKCFRYPGWRLGWVVAPSAVIQKITAAGSFLDGGTSRPVQRGAIRVLEPARADQETKAVRTVFARKQRLTLDSLTAMGVRFPAASRSTFYVYGDVSGLPAPINTGEGFMNEGFKHQVLTVPGEFFDVNPGKHRPGESRLRHFVRFSFGPPEQNLVAGLSRLGEMVKKFR
ncbi:MAG: pyridoxal phosphate-dependent aminotransferase [Planctomycetes bacterium]|nr:pyridoxal phosphate-dependent aminotransferase [Planctomycetota bacterium]